MAIQWISEILDGLKNVEYDSKEFKERSVVFRALQVSLMEVYGEFTAVFHAGF